MPESPTMKRGALKPRQRRRVRGDELVGCALWSCPFQLKRCCLLCSLQKLPLINKLLPLDAGP